MAAGGGERACECRSFSLSPSQLERLFVETVHVRYLYTEGRTAYLQNPVTFDQARNQF